MMDRRNALCLCLILAFPSLMVAADEVSVKGSMTVGGKTYELTSVKAYRIKSDGRDSIAVIVSAKPVQISESKIFPLWEPEEKPRLISLFWIRQAESRSSVPHVQAIFDEKTGKLTTFQSWADSTTFNYETPKDKQDSEAGSRGNAQIHGKMIVGSGKSTDDFPPWFLHSLSFDFKFKAAIEQLDIAAAK